MKRIGHHLRYSVSTTKFIILVTLFNALFYHIPLFSYAVTHLDMRSVNGILTFLSVLIALFVFTSFVLFMLAVISRRVLQLFTAFMMTANAIALYFIVTYHVILDKTMMGNVFHTNLTEATSYYHPSLVGYLFFAGIVPASIVAKVTIQKQDRMHLLLRASAILLTGIVLLYVNAQTWLWLDKHAKILGGLTLPWSYTINAIRYKRKQWKESRKEILLPPGTFADDQKMIVVLVIGESARADHFSLYGYPRKTNPHLEKIKDIIALKARSTATYTTASVHSMLSCTGSDSDAYEPLPNYLQRMGADVFWRTKNWGQPVLHVGHYETATMLRPACRGDECDFDGVLLTDLDREILASDRNKVFVVLHTSGSHGPLYSQKYPKRFEIFKPVCKTVDLHACNARELINAYDNTIVYTDHFLSRLIDKLKKIENIPVLMIYMSDHGESLGEYGLYLHGTPYSIAPDAQKNIPFILWASDTFIRYKGFDKNVLSKEKIYGQNSVFHTVLGAFGLKSPVYNSKLDLFGKD